MTRYDLPNFGDVAIRVQAIETPADLTGMSGPPGWMVFALDPPTLYGLSREGWVPLASLEGATLPALGNHNLFSATHPDVGTNRSDGDVLVWRPSTSLYEHEDFMGLVAAATETAAGKVEQATEAEVQAGTAGNLVATAARLKAELDRRLTPEAWIAPTLLNSWVNFGGAEQTAGYRKLANGEVQLRGVVKDGTTTAGTVLFTLPVGYRPSLQRNFVGLASSVGATCRLLVSATGGVIIGGGLTSNAFLSLEGLRFDAA